VVQFVAARERPWTGGWASVSKEWSPSQKLITLKEVESEKFKYEEDRQRENGGGVVQAVTFPSRNYHASHRGSRRRTHLT